jgi:hypothetical protein
MEAVLLDAGLEVALTINVRTNETRLFRWFIANTRLYGMSLHDELPGLGVNIGGLTEDPDKDAIARGAYVDLGRGTLMR